MISSWWTSQNEPALSKEFYGPESSFILEIKGQPALHLSLLVTNCKGAAYLENFVGNPELKGDSRKKGSKFLIDCLCDVAKQLGYKNIIGFAYKDKTKKYYPTLGFKNTLENVSVFSRRLSWEV
jgi:hypothetical protein